MEQLSGAFAYLFTGQPFLVLLAGVAAGIIFGAAPGLTGVMAMALKLPITLFMDSGIALILMLSLYMGAGANIGARSGLAAFAGGLVGWVMLAALAAPLAAIAGRLGPFEIFSLLFAALILFSSLGQRSVLKGLAAGFLGAAISMIGAGALGGTRLTFGLEELEAGFRLLPVILGILVLGPVLGGVIGSARPAEKTGTAAAAAKSAAHSGAVLPLISLGIPAGGAGVLLLGALLLHGLAPGPRLFRDAAGAAYGIIAAAPVANFVVLAVRMTTAPLLALLADISRGYLVAPIVVFAFIGAFSQDNRLFDVWVMAGFGLLAALMQAAKAPTAPLLIGYMLAPMAEAQLRAGLALSHGTPWSLVTRPVSLLFLSIAVIALAWPYLRRRR